MILFQFKWNTIYTYFNLNGISCQDIFQTFNAGCFKMISGTHSYSNKIKMKKIKCHCVGPRDFNKNNKKKTTRWLTLFRKFKSLIWVIDIKSIDCNIVYIFEPFLGQPHLAFLLKWFPSVTYFLFKKVASKDPRQIE